MTTRPTGTTIISTGGMSASGFEMCLAGSHSKVAREREHERHLHQLRRLEAQVAELQPALRAAGFDADQRHRRQQGERHEIDRIGEPHPDPDVGERHREQKPEAEAIADHVGLGPGIERAAGDRIERRRADAGEAGDQQHEDPVEGEQLLAEAQTGRFEGSGEHLSPPLRWPFRRPSCAPHRGRRSRACRRDRAPSAPS